MSLTHDQSAPGRPPALNREPPQPTSDVPSGSGCPAAIGWNGARLDVGHLGVATWGRREAVLERHGVTPREELSRRERAEPTRDLRSIQKAGDQRLQAILAEEQWKQPEAMREESRAVLRERMQAG